MKNKIFALLAILAVFGLAIATYAYNRTSSTALAKVSCCKNADSCPMKGKGNHEHAGDHQAKAEDHKCCGDSCPMKNKGGEQTKAEGHNCCGDSCPMKKKDGDAKGTAASVAEDGKNCCDNCDCCKGKTKAETAAV